ncbi:MAG: hypothetical protein WCS89_01270 [Candidatus Paceibacterota bacterium]|jgi:Ca2+/Na+ antiporter
MKDQIEKIDNVLITASIALLAAFVVLYSLQTGQTVYFKISTIVSIVLLVLCLLLTLYAKYRESLRKSIFDSQKDKWKSDFESDLDKIMKEFYTPSLLQFIKVTLSNEENKKALEEKTRNVKDILESERLLWEKENKSQHEYPRKLFAENQGLKIQRMLDSTFSGPLKEKHAIVKYQIEMLSQKRFTLFVLGLLAFIVSVAAKLFA